MASLLLLAAHGGKAIDDEETRERVAAVIAALRLAFENRTAGTRQEVVYRHAYLVVQHKHAAKLYKAVKRAIWVKSFEAISRENFMTAATISRNICMQMERTLYIPRKQLTPILELAENFHAERIPRALSRWRRCTPLVGRWAKFFREWYDEVTYRPQHSGAKRSRAEFEATSCVYDRKLV